MSEPTLADVIAEVRDMRIELSKHNQARSIDLSDPVWTHAHIAKMMQVSVQYARQNIVKSSGFPAPRKIPVGAEGAMILRPRYDRDAVMHWYQSQPVEISLS